MLAGSHRNAWPDETGTGGRTNRNTQLPKVHNEHIKTKQTTHRSEHQQEIDDDNETTK